MPNAPDHLDPKEATEAKLCAYLEGELSPEDRVDIEKHLKSNPHHRQLLTDLAETREWMRTIPKESAPPELAEAFAAHMERSMLLDYQGEQGGSTINRLPQYALLAAIVMLTLGLGVLIAVMLRGGQGYTIAPSVKSTGGPAAASKAPAADTSAVESPNPAVTVLADKSIALSPAAVAPVAHADASVMAFSSRAVTPATPSMVTPVNMDQDVFNKLEHTALDRVTSGSRRRVALVVTTPNPTATAEQVRRFFTSNRLAFDDEQSSTESKDLQIASAPPAAISPAAINPAAIKMAESAVGGAAENGATQNANFQNDRQQNGEPSTAAGQVPGIRNFVAGAGRPGAVNVVPSTAPARPLVKQDETNGSRDLVYVGHALTPLQLELLHGTLVTGGIDQTVKRLDLSRPASDEKPGPTPIPTSDGATISRGQSLTVTVPQLVGPGIEKTNVVKVADDGTISLPMLDPVPAVGTSPVELQGRIAAKYKEANLIPSATVTVAVNTPTTQPATQPTIATTANPTAMLATTHPITTATTQPAADDKVDVVVYVQLAK